MHIKQRQIVGICQPETTVFLWREIIEEKLREDAALAASMGMSPESEQEPHVSQKVVRTERRVTWWWHQRARSSRGSIPERGNIHRML